MGPKALPAQTKLSLISHRNGDHTATPSFVGRLEDLFLTLEAEVNLFKINPVSLILGERAATTTADKRFSALVFAGRLAGSLQAPNYSFGYE